MAEIKRMSLVKPTVKTRFHIDFDWWSQNDRDWRVYLRSFLCPEHQQAFAEITAYPPHGLKHWENSDVLPAGSVAVAVTNMP